MCLPSDLERQGLWNYRAAGIYGFLLLLLIYPFLRGWGRVLVTFQFPPKMRPLFNVRLSRRQVRAVKMDDTGDQITNKWQIEEKLKKSSMFERPLEGDHMVFRRVPARGSYWVTVRGPMIDSLSGKASGAFQEQRQIRVQRGKETVVDFDLRPKEAAIEVSVYDGDSLHKYATVALRGNTASQVYARAKSVYLYAEPGQYVVVAAADGRLAERTIQVDSTDAIQVSFDLAETSKLVFEGCEEAVAPYLAGELTAVSEALEKVGNQHLAHTMRAQHYADSGDARAASLELEKAGDLLGAAELRAQTDDEEGSAILFEEAGDYARAAEAYRAQGDVTGAARAFERAHDLDNAIRCYKELGDVEGLVTVLEKAGQHYEAAEAAEELCQIDRAMHNYRVIDQNDPRYGDACCRVGLLYQQKGELDLAIEKFEEARERLGGDLFRDGPDFQTASHAGRTGGVCRAPVLDNKWVG